MKKQYQKPLFTVEFYALTQAISACEHIKINSLDANCVMSDPDSTNMMMNWAFRGGFLGFDNCEINLAGDKYDSVCYHTNINSAFTS